MVVLLIRGYLSVIQSHFDIRIECFLTRIHRVAILLNTDTMIHYSHIFDLMADFGPVSSVFTSLRDTRYL
jgi:hypothetical protein